MRDPGIVGLLAWYDESPSWLSASVAAAARVCDHLIAVDGAYAGFPGGEPCSESGQAEAIREVCHALGVGYTIHTPRHVWAGGQVEKRTRMFELALTVCEPGRDWLFVIDADEVVLDAPEDLRARLADTGADVAGVTMIQRYDPEAWPEMVRVIDVEPGSMMLNHRKLFRALPGLHVDGCHYCYRTGDTVLWGPGETPDAADMNDLRVLHRNMHRPLARKRKQETFYRLRAELGLERAPEPVPA